jgi:hypothetical protein
MHQGLLRLSSVTVLLAPLHAQTTVVSPAHFTNAEGPSSNSTPFGIPTTPYRYVGIHDDLLGAPGVVLGMAVRRNANTTTVFPAASVTLSAWVSTAATTAGAPNATFDLNHGTDKQQVINSRTYGFPQSELAFAPSPFVYVIPFEVPFPFGGAAGLCWEVQITSRTNTIAIGHDAVQGGSTNPPLGAAWFGTGCTVTGQSSAMSGVSAGSINWTTGTGTIGLNSFFGPLNAGVLMLVGTNDQSFGGVPLPFLLPGSDLAPSGPCRLYTDVLFAVGGTTSAAGISLITTPVPARTDLHGLRTFCQLLAIDAPANPTGVVLGNAINHNWVAPFAAPPVGRVSASSLAATGTVGANAGVIVRFTR